MLAQISAMLYYMLCIDTWCYIKDFDCNYCDDYTKFHEIETNC